MNRLIKKPHKPTPTPEKPATVAPRVERIRIVDIDISWGRLITIWLNVLIAAIPAVLLLGLAFFSLKLVILALLGIII